MNLPQLEVLELSKKLGNRVALNNVSFQIHPGEVVGLADRTGTAKSTLVQIMSGILPPDSGALLVEGQKLSFPWVPEKQHISIVYQDPVLANFLDVTSNIFLGNEICYPFLGKWLRVPNQFKMDLKGREVLDRLDARLPFLHEKVINLSEQQRQLVAIAQVLVRKPKLVVLEDVDALLSLPYQEKLLDVIRMWQGQNTAVLFSSKNLDHLFAVSDRIVVLREGQVASNVRTDETSRAGIVTALVGTGSRQQRTPVVWAFDNYYQARKQAETLHHQSDAFRTGFSGSRFT